MSIKRQQRQQRSHIAKLGAAWKREHTMATMTIRNLPDDIHRALRVRAAMNERSAEAEVRAILDSVLNPPQQDQSLVEALREFGQIAQFTPEEMKLFERDKTPHSRS